VCLSSTMPIQSRAAALGRRSLSPLHDPQRLTHCTTAVFDHIRAGSLESTATRPLHAGLTPSRPELVGYSAPAVSRGSPRGDRRLPCGRQHQPPTTLADCSPSSSAQPRQREEDAGATSAGGTSARRRSTVRVNSGAGVEHEQNADYHDQQSTATQTVPGRPLPAFIGERRG